MSEGSGLANKNGTVDRALVYPEGRAAKCVDVRRFEGSVNFTMTASLSSYRSIRRDLVLHQLGVSGSQICVVLKRII